jgi:hypothetical protein
MGPLQSSEELILCRLSDPHPTAAETIAATGGGSDAPSCACADESLQQPAPHRAPPRSLGPSWSSNPGPSSHRDREFSRTTAWTVTIGGA